MPELRGRQRAVVRPLGGLGMLVHEHGMAENRPKGQEMCRTVYDNGAINAAKVSRIAGAMSSTRFWRSR